MGMREEFEADRRVAWAQDEGSFTQGEWLLKRSHSGYADMAIQHEWAQWQKAYVAGQRAAVHEETRRLAAVALVESSGYPMVCDWMVAALKVCAAIHNRKDTP